MRRSICSERSACTFARAEGTASLEIPRLLPEPLIPVASALLYKAARDQTYLMSDAVDVTLVNGERRSVRIVVQPLEVETEERLSLLSFHSEAPREVVVRIGRRRCRDHGTRYDAGT